MLTLTATILTVVVIDDDVLNWLFGETVSINAEGVLVGAADSSAVTDGLPFTEETVHRLLTEEPMASPGPAFSTGLGASETRLWVGLDLVALEVLDGHWRLVGSQ